MESRNAASGLGLSSAIALPTALTEAGGQPAEFSYRGTGVGVSKPQVAGFPPRGGGAAFKTGLAIRHPGAPSSPAVTAVQSAAERSPAAATPVDSGPLRLSIPGDRVAPSAPFSDVPSKPATNGQPQSAAPRSSPGVGPAAPAMPQPATPKNPSSDTDDGTRAMTLGPLASSLTSGIRQFDTTSGGSGGSGGGGGSGGSGGGDPSVYFSGGGPGQSGPILLPDGTYIDTIADAVAIAVTAGYGESLGPITWDVDGGIQSQTYSDDTGFTDTALPSEVIETPDAGATNTSFGFYWDSEPERNHTITAKVIQYDRSGNRSEKDKVFVVNVQPPTNVNFVDTFLSNKFQVTNLYNKTGANEIGFTQIVPNPPGAQLAAAPGNVFTATLTTPNNPNNKQSSFTVLNIVTNMYNKIVYIAGNSSIRKANNALDKPAGNSTNFLNDITMGPFGPALKVNLPQDAQNPQANYSPYLANALDDSPSLLTLTNTYPNGGTYGNGGNYAVGIQQNVSFATYLMYKATDRGLYIGISEIDWSLTGTATLKPENGVQG